jgi:transcriptional regulator with XRE-family HTH domain
MNKLGKWLNEEIERRGWTQRELARRTQNVTQTTISRIISGQTSPEVDTLEGIARAFGLSLEEVMRKAGILPAFTELPDGAKTWGGRLTELSDDLRPLAVAAMEAALRAVESAAQSSRR